MADKALRLDAPHRHIAVQSEDDEDEFPGQLSTHEEYVGSGEQAGLSGNAGSSGANSEAQKGCLTAKSVREPKVDCNHCGSDICQGEFKARKPTLMMLGSGELKAIWVK